MHQKLISFVSVLAITLPAVSQQAPPAAEIEYIPYWKQVKCKKPQSSLFSQETPLKVVIKSSRSTFDFNADLKAEMKTLDSGKADNPIPVTLKVRGKSRQYSCQFKPIRILFGDDKDREGTVFDHIKGSDIKLITHCQYTSGKISEHLQSNEFVAREHSLYQFLRATGLPSFATRLVQVSYRNSDDVEVAEGLGVFVEPNASFAKRCGLEHVKSNDLSAKILAADPRINVTNLISRLFVDASDFIVSMGHNTESFSDNTGTIKMLVPYDLNDSSTIQSRGTNGGFQVSAYAWGNKHTWPEWFDLLLKGPFGRDGGLIKPELTSQQLTLWLQELRSVVDHVIQRKEAVMKRIDEMPLQADSKDVFNKYFESFFTELQRIQAQIQ